MNITAKYKNLLREVRRSLSFWTQSAKRDFTDDLLLWMERRDVNQARLAEILNVSPQFITKVLRTNANLTIETMTKLALALDCQVRIHLADKHASTEWRDRPADLTRFTMQLPPNVTFLDPAKVRMIVRGSERRDDNLSVVNG